MANQKAFPKSDKIKKIPSKITKEKLEELEHSIESEEKSLKNKLKEKVIGDIIFQKEKFIVISSSKFISAKTHQILFDIFLFLAGAFLAVFLMCISEDKGELALISIIVTIIFFLLALYSIKLSFYVSFKELIK